MLYILALVVIALGLVKKKSNIVFMAILLLIWLMFGWSSENADYLIHLGRFNNYELTSIYTEALYTMLMRCANYAGLTYQQFLPLVMLVYVTVIGFIVKKESKAPAFVLALYMIFPACMEAVQVRYTLASALVLLGFYFLFKENDKLGELKFVSMVILAAFMHISTIVFILFLLVKRLNKSRTILYTAILSVIIYSSRASFVINLIGKLPGMAEKTSRVLVSAANKYTMITVMKTAHRCIVFFAVFMFLLYLLKKWNEKYKLELNISYIEKMQKANIISLAILPLLFYSVDFYRIQQTLSLLNYCALSYYAVILPEARNLVQREFTEKISFVTTRKRIGYVLGCVGMAVLNLYYLVLNSNNLFTVFKPFFENNLFFGGVCKEKRNKRFENFIVQNSLSLKFKSYFV